MSISAFGRKNVCRLACNTNYLENWELRCFFWRENQQHACATFVTQLKCYRIHSDPSRVLSSPLKRFIIAIRTSLARQLLRQKKNAWYFYTDISAGSNGNFGGNAGRTSDRQYVVFKKPCPWVSQRLRTICAKPKHCKNAVGVSDHRSKCWNTLGRFQWSF